MGSELDPTRDGEKAFTDRTRRMLARAVRMRPSTLSGLEPVLRRKEGSFRGSAALLEGWGILRHAPGSTADRVVYAFNSAWSEALNESLRRHAFAEFNDSAELILIPTEDAVAAGDVVAQMAREQRPLWGIRFSPSNFGLLLAFESDVDEHAAVRAYGALRNADVNCALIGVQRLLDADELVAYCRSLSNAAPGPALPPTT